MSGASHTWQAADGQKHSQARDNFEGVDCAQNVSHIGVYDILLVPELVFDTDEHS